ncbi:MAG: hypothetical protein FWE50_04255 [Alphaproteobacteria bacterium]|nr:hypothetical protein [Alphaproteobacteria bacterium]
MREKSSIIAQRLLNLYRQAHVLNGGWAAVNQVLLHEADTLVLEELMKLPNGSKLAEHIRNLQSGKTAKNSIERELMPYGGLMDRAAKGTSISDTDLKELEVALADFQPDEEHIEKIRSLPMVQSFGEKWQSGVRAAVARYPELAEKWRQVQQTSRAYELWNRGYAMLEPPVSDRARAQIQADLSEYETYLPMFGEDGTKLLVRLRAFMSSV